MLRFLLSLTAHLWKFNGYDGLTAAIKWLQADKVGWSSCTCDTPPSHPLHALSVSVCLCLSVCAGVASLSLLTRRQGLLS